MRKLIMMLGLLGLVSCHSLATAPKTAIVQKAVQTVTVTYRSWTTSSSFLIDVKVTGHGEFGQPNGWYVTGLYSVPPIDDEWDYRLECYDWGLAPHGKQPFYLANMIDDKQEDVTTSYSTNGDEVFIILPLARVPVGTNYWFWVHEIDANGVDGGVPDGWEFDDQIYPASNLGVPYHAGANAKAAS